MSYLNRPYESNYYEADREVIREGPYGNYSAEYRIDEYGNRVPHHNYNQNQHHQNGVAGVVKEIWVQLSQLFNKAPISDNLNGVDFNTMVQLRSLRQCDAEI
uniref:Uncharacterized protein n=1 Tax=Chenopodium quinoa TaxID=63459 RepID=A0A803LWH1_CHEQI